jgi:predicted dehydrogenase
LTCHAEESTLPPCLGGKDKKATLRASARNRMSEEKIGVGVIGAGSIGKYHMEAYGNHPRADLLAVAEVNEERARAVQEQFPGVRIFSDYREMLGLDEITAVSVCLPNALHAPASIDALKAGKHVLCEKPMSTDAASAERMLIASVESGARLALSLNLRHTGRARALMDLVESGHLGRIYHGKGGMLRDNAIPRGWFHRKDLAGGGPLLDLGPHILDVTWWIMGRPRPVAVSGATYAELGPKGVGMGSWGVGWEEGPFDVEDFALGLIRFQEGQTLLVEASWALKAKMGKYSYICGTEGGAVLYPEVEAFGLDGNPIQLAIGEDEKPPARFVDDLLEKRPFLAPAEDGVTVMKMLDAVYRSAASGREVLIE